MPENITFRTQLLGGVTEFCQSSALPIFSNSLHLVELIVKLARYQEEGVRLSPKVYLTNDIRRIGNLLPGGEILKIGMANPDSEGIKAAIKKCAPLATEGWLLYISNENDKIEYGLFRGSENPISVLVDDVLLGNDDYLRIVKVHQVADECVEVRSNKGEYHYIFLDHRKEDAKPPLYFIDNLVNAITSNVDPELKEPTISFLKRILFNSLRESHGCLIAVTGMKKPPKFLIEDGIVLEEPINFPELISKLKKNEIDASHIESKASLLKGMLNSDGILLFNNTAKLLGYNFFVKPKKSDNVIGGARKRAFAFLSSKVNNGLSSVFMQSQDGWSDFVGEKQ